jgi:peptidoglycan hydrolase-like protein with peptidoglycan-binding domain
MTDTLWADVSVWQRVVDDSYPHPFFCFRSNDGAGYRDRNFAPNRAWADGAVASGKIAGYLVYYVYRPGSDSVGTLQAMCGTPSAHMAVMIDLESWGGQIRGDHSENINADYQRLAAWLGNPARVVGYGNVGDLNSLWPHKPAGIRLVVASYGANPGYPGKFAHQFADNYRSAPFGPCDINSADGMAPSDVVAMLGLGAGPAPAPPSTPPAPGPTHAPDNNPWTFLAEDGGFGPQTTRALQWKLGVAQDGVFGPQSRRALQAHLRVSVDGIVGPVTVRALQIAVHALADGKWGPATTRALQRALNLGAF